MIPLGVLAAAYPRAVAPASGWTFNPALTAANIALSNGNKTASSTGTPHLRSFGTAPRPQSGKWYIEIQVDSVTSGSGDIAFGVTRLAESYSRSTYPAEHGQAAYWSRLSGALARLYFGATYTALPSVAANVAKTGDIITFALDFDASQYQVFLNGVLLNATPKATAFAAGDCVPYVALWGGAANPTQVTIMDAPQHPPSGFLPW